MQVWYISVKQMLYTADSIIYTNYPHFVISPWWFLVTALYYSDLLKTEGYVLSIEASISQLWDCISATGSNRKNTGE